MPSSSSFYSYKRMIALLCSLLCCSASAFQQPPTPQNRLLPFLQLSQSIGNSRTSVLSSRVASESQQHGAEERRQQSLKQGNHPLISLNLNLDALAQSGAAPRAQELLQRIHALYNDGYYEVSPDTVSFNSVLKAWKESDNPEKAYELLQEMINDSDSNLSSVDDGSNDSIRANVVSFNTVILAFAHQGNYVRAQEMLQEMKEQSNLPNPDTITYNSVLAALAKSPDPGTALIAENILKEMMQPDSDVTVDTITFNTVIHAWSKMGDRSSAHRAQQLLHHMEQLAAAGSTTVIPDLYSYTTVIQAWAKCGKPSRAQEVMESMIAHDVSPNRFTYTAVMSSLSKSGEAEKAEEVLESMMLEYSNGNEDMKPDTAAVSAVMDGWAKLSNIDKPEAAERALELLQRMKDLENVGMGPNSRTFTSVLTCLAKSGTWDACTRARSLLNEMEQEYENGSINMEPTNIHFNAVLNAYARSPRADKALKAAGLLREMEEHNRKNCRPDIISYNTLLLACSNAFGNKELRQRSYIIAVEAFKAAMVGTHDVQPTSTTFSNFLRASRRLVDPDKRPCLLRKTFKLCCKLGLVNKAVMLQIKQACLDDEEWETVVESAAQFIHLDDRVQISRLPQSWTCHARR